MQAGTNVDQGAIGRFVVATGTHIAPSSTFVEWIAWQHRSAGELIGNAAGWGGKIILLSQPDGIQVCSNCSGRDGPAYFQSTVSLWVDSAGWKRPAAPESVWPLPCR